MENLYPFSTERTSLLGTEAFRNLLGEAVKNSKKSVVVVVTMRAAPSLILL